MIPNVITTGKNLLYYQFIATIWRWENYDMDNKLMMEFSSMVIASDPDSVYTGDSQPFTKHSLSDIDANDATTCEVMRSAQECRC